MRASTFILANLAYVVFNFAFALTWNLGLFKTLYAELTGPAAREKPIIPLGLIAILVQGLALSTTLVLSHSGESPIRTGLVYGLLLGSFSTVYGAFVVPAKFRVSPVWKYAVLESVYGILHYGIAGIIVAYVLS